MQVFFSVDGEDLAGNQLEDGDASGVMRMLVLPIPVMMPSVSIGLQNGEHIYLIQYDCSAVALLNV